MRYIVAFEIPGWLARYLRWLGVSAQPVWHPKLAWPWERHPASDLPASDPRGWRNEPGSDERRRRAKRAFRTTEGRGEAVTKMTWRIGEGRMLPIGYRLIEAAPGKPERVLLEGPLGPGDYEVDVEDFSALYEDLIEAET